MVIRSITIGIVRVIASAVTILVNVMKVRTINSLPPVKCTITIYIAVLTISQVVPGRVKSIKLDATRQCRVVRRENTSKVRNLRLLRGQVYLLLCITYYAVCLAVKIYNVQRLVLDAYAMLYRVLVVLGRCTTLNIAYPMLTIYSVVYTGNGCKRLHLSTLLVRYHLDGVSVTLILYTNLYRISRQCINCRILGLIEVYVIENSGQVHDMSYHPIQEVLGPISTIVTFKTSLSYHRTYQRSQLLKRKGIVRIVSYRRLQEGTIVSHFIARNVSLLENDLGRNIMYRVHCNIKRYREHWLFSIFDGLAINGLFVSACSSRMMLSKIVR